MSRGDFLKTMKELPLRGAAGFHSCYFLRQSYRKLHPQRLTCPLKRDPFKRKNHLPTTNFPANMICSIISFQGGYLLNPPDVCCWFFESISNPMLKAFGKGTVHSSGSSNPETSCVPKKGTSSNSTYSIFLN